MKILFIITGLRSSGAELMLFKLCLSLVHRKNELFVISLTSVGDLGKNFNEIGIPVLPLGLNKNLFSNIPKLYNLYVQIKRYSPDLVHTWMYHADLIGGLVSKIAGVRCIIWCIRNSNLSLINTKLSTRIVLSICSTLSSLIPTKIVCCSRNAINIHIEKGYYKDAFVHIPNGFDTNLFKPSTENHIQLKNELAVPLSNRLIGVVGRYDPQKNHLGFITCIHKLSKIYNDLSFIFVGDLLDCQNLELVNLINKYNLKNIFLLGKRDDIPFIMSSLDIFVSPSIYGEAFPNVIGEAMSCGIPCVVTDVGDSSLIVGNCGYTVPPNNSQNLVDAVSILLNLNKEDHTRLSIESRNKITGEYEIVNISKKYAGLYRHLLLCSHI